MENFSLSSQKTYEPSFFRRRSTETPSTAKNSLEGSDETEDRSGMAEEEGVRNAPFLNQARQPDTKLHSK
jgi:hypothetical protein